LQDVNNTGPETLPVSVCNCFLYFTCEEKIFWFSCICSVGFILSQLLCSVKNWNRKCLSGPVLFNLAKWSIHV